MAALATELGYPSTTAEVRRRLRRILKQPGHRVFVAEKLRVGVVGWAHVFVHALVEADTFAEVGGLVVDKRERGGGIGKRLMKHIETWARARGAKAVSLRSNVIRKGAHAFYQKLGYQIIKTQFAFRKDLRRAASYASPRASP
jgi:GNAT superfamily N-acetyltransferase